ncbi:phosphate ABC transporter permease PstA, partial [Streptomyces sp. MBT62]|uniref:phosphate ABC transporter permease PstA n=1 Tax=Streptomyces sp. MBT62 TaxID=2800410 RepID=UPI00190E1337
MSVLLFGELAPFSGALGFAVTWYAVSLVVYGVLTGLEENAQAVRDRVMTVVLWTAAGLLFSALAMVVGFTLWRGREALTYLNFFHQDMQAAGPLDPLGVGGIAHAMIGTLLMITIALLITVPLGLACAVYLNQIPGRFSRFVRTIVEAMTALPSIVAGLMVYAVWVLQLGMEKSGLAAGFAISVMMLPIVIRAADVVLRLVPGTLTEAAEALGAPRWRTVWHVVLPTARSGLATAVILGTARGIGETSPVLLTAGFTAATNYDPLHGPMISLPLAVFSFVRSPEPAMIARGFGAAAVLMALVLILFVIARVIGGRGPGQQTRSQARRTARASRRDAARFDELRGPGLSLFDTHPHESSESPTTRPTPAFEPPAPTDGEPAPQAPPAPDNDGSAPQGPPAPDDETATHSARSGVEADTESAHASDDAPVPTTHEPPAAAAGDPAPQGRPAPADATVTNTARSGGEADTAGPRRSDEPPAPANGEPAPQRPPAPGNATVTHTARSGGEADTAGPRRSD